MRNYIAALIVIAIVILGHGPACASEAEMMAEIRALKSQLADLESLKTRVVELEKRIDVQQCSITTGETTVAEIKNQLIQYKPGEGLKVPPCGLEITADSTFVIQGTPNANNAGDKEDSRCDAAWSADIFITKMFGEHGMALMHLEPGQGQGAEEDLWLFSNVNRDQNDTAALVPITELWYEHYLFNRQVAITAGKMDPANYIDQNEFAHDETTQFLGRIFKQNPAIEWPDDNTLASRIVYGPEFAPYVALEAVYFDANNDWEDVFSRPFIAAQFTFQADEFFGADPEQWNGNYRFYWWLNDRDHSKLVGEGENPADDAKNANTGLGFSFDQMVTDVFGAFARFGWQNPALALAATSSPNSAPCEVSWSGGMQMTGKYWSRPDDVAAIGVGQVFPKPMLKNIANGDGGAPENHLEIYYKLQLFKWLALTPDFQWIWNPHGINQPYQGDDNTIFVYGVRGQVDF